MSNNSDTMFTLLDQKARLRNRDIADVVSIMLAMLKASSEKDIAAVLLDKWPTKSLVSRIR